MTFHKSALLKIFLCLALAVPACCQIGAKAGSRFPFEFGPMNIGVMKEYVGVSDQQLEQISGIYESNRHNLIDLGADVAKKEGDVRAVLNMPQVDTAQVDKAVDALIESRGRLAKSTTMMMVRMRQILTLDQWRRLDEFAQNTAAHPEYTPLHPDVRLPRGVPKPAVAPHAPAAPRAVTPAPAAPRPPEF